MKRGTFSIEVMIIFLTLVMAASLVGAWLLYKDVKRASAHQTTLDVLSIDAEKSLTYTVVNVDFYNRGDDLPGAEVNITCIYAGGSKSSIQYIDFEAGQERKVSTSFDESCDQVLVEVTWQQRKIVSKIAIPVSIS